MAYFFGRDEIIISIILYCIIALFMKIRCKKSNLFMFFFTLMYVYLVIVVKYTQFPIMNTEDERRVLAETYFQYNLNIIPFRRIFNMTSLLNVILFIPFGFLEPLLAKLNWIKALISGVVFSLCIEGIQLAVVLVIGYSFRFIDVNDIICNTIGAMIGFFVFKVFANIIEGHVEKTQDTNCILSYICDMAMNKNISTF